MSYIKIVIGLVFIVPALTKCAIDTNQQETFFADQLGKEKVIIDLKKYNLDSVPAAVGSLTSAKRLIIVSEWQDGWSIYPPAAAMRGLRKAQPLRHLPNEICNLTQLTSLTLSDLDLVSLPKDFGNLKNLDTLSLFLNKLTIADELDKLIQLKSLSYLDVSANHVDSTDVAALKQANPDLTVIF